MQAVKPREQRLETNIEGHVNINGGTRAYTKQ